MTEAANKIAIIEPSAVPAPPSSDVRVFDPMALLDKAVSGGASLDMIDRLVSLGERMQAMKARQAFDAAIAAAKAEIPVIVKNRLVDFVGKEHTAAVASLTAEYTRNLQAAGERYDRLLTEATQRSFAAVTTLSDKLSSLVDSLTRHHR
jgi:hypothetical protein